MRRRYERKSDLRAELEIATEWAARWWPCSRMKPHKLDIEHGAIDFAFLNGIGALRAVGEVKDRPGWKQSYGNVILSLHKYRALQGWELRGVPAYFIVRFPHGIGAVRVQRNSTPLVKIAGRSDRNDPKDQELCVHLDVGHFVFQPQ